MFALVMALSEPAARSPAVVPVSLEVPAEEPAVEVPVLVEPLDVVPAVPPVLASPEPAPAPPLDELSVDDPLPPSEVELALPPDVVLPPAVLPPDVLPPAVVPPAVPALEPPASELPDAEPVAPPEADVESVLPPVVALPLASADIPIASQSVRTCSLSSSERLAHSDISSSLARRVVPSSEKKAPRMSWLQSGEWALVASAVLPDPVAAAPELSVCAHATEASSDVRSVADISFSRDIGGLLVLSAAWMLAALPNRRCLVMFHAYQRPYQRA
jgi:hypothetical protein